MIAAAGMDAGRMPIARATTVLARRARKPALQPLARRELRAMLRRAQCPARKLRSGVRIATAGPINAATGGPASSGKAKIRRSRPRDKPPVRARQPVPFKVMPRRRSVRDMPGRDIRTTLAVIADRAEVRIGARGMAVSSDGTATVSTAGIATTAVAANRASVVATSRDADQR